MISRIHRPIQLLLILMIACCNLGIIPIVNAMKTQQQRTATNDNVIIESDITTTSNYNIRMLNQTGHHHHHNNNTSTNQSTNAPTPAITESNTDAETTSNTNDSTSSETSGATSKSTPNPTPSPTTPEPSSTPSQFIPFLEREKENLEKETEKVNELIHDPTADVLAALFFFLGIVGMLITAQQILEKPDGLCSSLCRLALTFASLIMRLLCVPCTLVCGYKYRGYQGGNPTNKAVFLQAEEYTNDLDLELT